MSLATGRVVRGGQGFSLVELLAALAVIGVLTSVALPAIGFSWGAASEVRTRANAQALVALSVNAKAVGTAVNPTSVDEWVEVLSQGVDVVTPDGNVLTTLRLDGIGESELEEVRELVVLNASTGALALIE